MSIETCIQLLTDPENQPHQYIGDPDGLRKLLEAAKLSEQPDDSPELLALIERVKWLIDDGVRWQGDFADMATHHKAQSDRGRLADFLNGTGNEATHAE
jgi:hypothetical protein